jgi:hypothetical protein
VEHQQHLAVGVDDALAADLIAEAFAELGGNFPARRQKRAGVAA